MPSIRIIQNERIEYDIKVSWHICRGFDSLIAWYCKYGIFLMHSFTQLYWSSSVFLRFDLSSVTSWGLWQRDVIVTVFRMKVLPISDTSFRNVIISVIIHGVTLKNLHNHIYHKVLIINIVVLTTKYNTDLTVSYTRARNNMASVWPNKITRFWHVVCNNKQHMELT